MSDRESRREGELIAMSTQLLGDASRILGQLVDGPLRLPGRAAPLGHQATVNGYDMCPATLLKRAVELFASRRHRELYFARAMFNEPAWDILLALYIRASSAPPFTIIGLSQHVRVPQSSTLRWVAYLARENLVERVSHPRDRRKSHVVISGKGRSVLSHYLADNML